MKTMTFTYERITYTVISKKGIPAVSTGTLETERQSNAVSSDFGPELIIPEQVPYNGKYHIVTEIGPYSFFECDSILSIFIPSSIEIIRTYGLARCRKCTNLTFAQNSKLKLIENNGLYDLYELPSLEFTSNCLKIVNYRAISFSYVIKKLVIPSSVHYVGSEALTGMKQLTDLYYCPLTKPDDDVFYTDSIAQTNENAKIHVSSSYKFSNVGKFTNLIKDADSYCIPKTTICSSFNITCQKKGETSVAVFIILILFSIK